jgi:glycerol-1-phosphate dehydrogenase [NAD(P)+]
MLSAAGAPTQPQQIGISRQRLRESYQQAYLIRRRFTVLDLAAQANVFEPCLDVIFSPAGPWPEADDRSHQTPDPSAGNR